VQRYALNAVIPKNSIFKSLLKALLFPGFKWINTDTDNYFFKSCNPVTQKTVSNLHSKRHSVMLLKKTTGLLAQKPFIKINVYLKKV
jgi:hypothetical protein